MPAALDVDWNLVEKAAIAGMDYAELSRTFGPSEPAIRKRASRFSWAIPRAVSQSVTKAKNEHLLAVTGQNMQETHAGTALQLVKASAKVLGAFAQKPAEVLDWNTAHVAYKVQRLAAGIDKEGTEVKVNLAMFSDIHQPEAPADEGPTWEAETVESEGGQVAQE